jgi:hypothetical protein
LPTTAESQLHDAFHPALDVPPPNLKVLDVATYDNPKPRSGFPSVRAASSRWIPATTRKLLREGGFEILRTDFQFLFPRLLGWFRGWNPGSQKSRCVRNIKCSRNPD